MDEQKKARQRYQNAVNNAQGHHFESYIRAACGIYRDKGRAEIEKTPEPFRVQRKNKDGTFVGRFTALAQPDFQGTTQGGRSIVFEAKYTRTDRLKRNILTGEQLKALEHHQELGAIAGVCGGIQGNYYFIPLEVWQDMKTLFGRQYVKAEEIEVYRIKFTGAVMFLDYTHGGKLEENTLREDGEADGEVAEGEGPN